MRQKTKKILSVFLMIMLVTIGMYEPVRAGDENGPSDDEVSLRYTNFSSISAGLSVTAGGVANCTGSVTMSNNLDCRLYIHLYKITSSGAYNKIQSWAQSYSGVGLKSLNKSKSVTRGYKYRIKVEVRVYNSAGTVIETAEKWSVTVNYT